MRQAAFLLALLIAGAANADTLTFTEGTFNPADWTVIVRGMGTTTASQILTGGNPDAFRQITNSVDGIMWGYHFKNSAVYNPSTQGAILSIDYSEDAILLDGTGTLGAGPAIIQGGKVFAQGFGTVGPTWTHRTFNNLHQSTFQHFHGEPGSAFPDFSATGGPITFGFWRGNAEGTFSMTTGIDNWSMTLHTNSVPEPSALTLAVGCGLALLRRRRGV